MAPSDPMDTMDTELPRYQPSTNRPIFQTNYAPPPQRSTPNPPPPPNTSSTSVSVPATLPTFLPPNLWNLPYITHANNLEIAVGIDAARVSELFAQRPTPSTLQDMPRPPPRLPAPPMQLYDGQPSGLRSFCSQLINQFQGQEGRISEAEKVRYAYQLLGPGALAKMRSSFRCLEDPSVPADIHTLSEFLAALRQRCQDPGLEERASCAVDNLQQKNMRFHEFITIFEDNMADSSYGSLDKSQWRVMLRRRLSIRLRNALVMATDKLTDYHKFVAYLRGKDTGFHEVKASINTSEVSTPTAVISTAPRLQNNPFPPTPPTREPTVSGRLFYGSGCSIRREGLDGRLTNPAKDARRALARCL